MMKDELERRRLIKRTVILRDEIEQLFNDGEHWNDTHPDKNAIDVDPKGELLALKKFLNESIARERKRQPERR